MEIGKKNQIILIVFLIFYGRHANYSQAVIERGQTSDLRDEIHVGVILDTGSREGKIISSCISMAISDFYAEQNFNTRIMLHTRNSGGEPLQALSVALDLLNNTKVEAIIGGQTRMEARFLAELGDKAGLPFISFSEPISYTSFKEYSFLVQITKDEVSQFKGMAAVVEAFNWRNVILIHEETNMGRDELYLIDAFQEKNINVKHRIAIAASFTEKRILEELHRFSTLQTTIFVVHISHLGLVSQFLSNAKKVGIMTEGYAWLLSATTMNLLHYVDFSVIESIQGAIGLKSYISASIGLRNLTLRLRREGYIENSNFDLMELGTSAILAYDSTWALAKAAEGSRVKTARSTKFNDNITLGLLELEKFRTSKDIPLLHKEILQSNFMGLSGQFQFSNGKLLTPQVFEIVNIIGKRDRRVGFFTHAKENKSNKRRQLMSPNDLKAIVWPGGSTTIPKVRSMMQKKLRIGVPVKKGFNELIRVDHDYQSNSTSVTGFCIDVFKAAVRLLPYQIHYEFLPFEDANGHLAGTYNELIFQVFLENYDVVVGDITISSNRSLYVDFTQPFSDLGVGMLVRGQNKNMWIFLKPLSTNLWITTGGFFLLIGFVVWVIERPSNKEFQGTISKQLGTSLWFAFSTLVFAQNEKLVSNLSKFVVIVWVFVLLILTSSYTATLASMMTVRQIQLNGGANYIGYQLGSFVGSRVQINNLDFKGLKPLRSVEEFAEALSKGSKHGGVSAIIDEIPYIKIFLAAYGSDQYSMAKFSASTNGFGFAFRKGSHLVRDMSSAIMKLRETGELENLERTWFNSELPLISEGSSNDPNALNLETFGGLFIMSGITFSVALLLFFVFYLRAKQDAVRNYLDARFQHLWMRYVTKFRSTNIHNRVHQDQEMNRM